MFKCEFSLREFGNALYEVPVHPMQKYFIFYMN